MAALQASTAFVAGATGGVGREIVKLLSQKKIRTTALVRDPDAAVRQSRFVLEAYTNAIGLPSGVMASCVSQHR